MERLPDLDYSLRHAWNMLVRATVKRNDPLRAPALATTSPEGPQLRTVILREVSPPDRSLLFFTDRRSSKMEDLARNGQAACLFYHPQKKVQIRMRGSIRAEVETEATRERWQRINEQGRASYASLQPPGTPVAVDTDGRPSDWPAAALQEEAYRNFCLLWLEVQEFEVLHLHAEGHQRARFSWRDRSWEKTWLIP